MKGKLVFQHDGVETCYEVEVVQPSDHKPYQEPVYIPSNRVAVEYLLDCSMALRLPIPLGLRVLSENQKVVA
jgi:hypothetical protein